MPFLEFKANVYSLLHNVPCSDTEQMAFEFVVTEVWLQAINNHLNEKVTSAFQCQSHVTFIRRRKLLKMCEGFHFSPN